MDPRLFKAYYRRAMALRELNRLDQALEDATKVCEHYMTQPAPNSEAWELRESIIKALKKEKTKWKTGKTSRWNKGTGGAGRGAGEDRGAARPRCPGLTHLGAAGGRGAGGRAGARCRGARRRERGPHCVGRPAVSEQWRRRASCAGAREGA